MPAIKNPGASLYLMTKLNSKTLATLRFLTALAGAIFIFLPGLAQHAALQPSYTLLSAGNASLKDYAHNRANIFSKADLHALAVSEQSFKNIEELSRALCISELNEVEKVRSIYFWLAKSISYDNEALSNNRFTSQAADSVFANQKAVCEGFANLFVQLCRASGIDARSITGYVKDDLYDNNKILTYPNHVWNAVKIDQKWHLLDVTWASFKDTAPHSQKRQPSYFSHKLESNFLIDPEVFVQTHLPQDPYWQLLAKPIQASAFFNGNIAVDHSIDIDVHRRIAEMDALDSLDREIAFCERMVENEWNSMKEYRLGIAYYYKAQQLYRQIGQFHGRQRERIEQSIQHYYDRSLAELSKLTPYDFGYEYCVNFIDNIRSRKELLSYR